MYTGKVKQSRVRIRYLLGPRQLYQFLTAFLFVMSMYHELASKGRQRFKNYSENETYVEDKENKSKNRSSSFRETAPGSSINACTICNSLIGLFLKCTGKINSQK